MNINNYNRVGWDVGGAHLKAVMLDANDVVVEAIQCACPLWQGIDQLSVAISQILIDLKSRSSDHRHAVTMTGELADIFKHRREGVLAIGNCLQQHLDAPKFYAAGKGLVASSDLEEMHERVASTNWHASAALLARMLGSGLLMDIGSTTTDLIVLQDGKALHAGLSDAERLRTNELVYTGVVRTPLMALAQHIEFKSAQYGLAAEHFATTADIYRLTGELKKTDDMYGTADGSDKSQIANMRRLARMIGHDLEDATHEDWHTLANTFRAKQKALITEAAKELLTKYSLPLSSPVIALGTGSFLVDAIAVELGRTCVHAEDLIKAESDEKRHWAGVCFPAFAVASLL